MFFLNDFSYYQDDFSHCYATFHKNTTHCGDLNSNYFDLKPHGLVRCFLECGPYQKIPNIAFGHSGDIEGYNFTSDYATKCSYLHVLDSLGKLNEKGFEDFSLKNFYGKKFFLPFSLSPSINHWDANTNEKIQQNSINPVTNERKLFLKFSSNLTYAIRIRVIYFQHRNIKIDASKRVWKDYDLDQ